MDESEVDQSSISWAYFFSAFQECTLIPGGAEKIYRLLPFGPMNESLIQSLTAWVGEAKQEQCEPRKSYNRQIYTEFAEHMLIRIIQGYGAPP